MHDFLGFINYNKNSTHTYHKKNNIEIHTEYDDYELFLSTSKSKYISLFNQENIFVYCIGSISNKTLLKSNLNIKDNLISDSKLIHKYFVHWGIRFLERMEGNFSIIIFDKNRETLYLIKDQIGLYPLFYSKTEKSIIFGSSLRAFNYAPHFHSEINPQGLALYLQFGYIMQPNTILKNCYKVRSGEYDLFNLKNKEKISQTYWSLESCYDNKKHRPNEQLILKNAENLLSASIEKNSIHSKQGVSLSGGYDSASIAALLQTQSDKKIETFTIGFENREINEAPYAKDIAQYLGTNHHEYYFSSQDAVNIIPKLSQYYEEPFSEYAAAPTILTAQLAKEKEIENFFIGDGGDEVFATADDVYLFQRLQKTPRLLKKVLEGSLAKLDLEKIPYLKAYNNLPTKYDKLFQMLTAKSVPEMVKARSTLFREKELLEQIKNYEQPIITTFNEIHFNGSHETVDEIIGTYFKTSMIDAELVKSYTAFHSVDIRPKIPFLDTKLIDYMAKVPASIKIKNGTKKYILKKIVHKYIPVKLMERPKMGFDIPFSSWMKKELKELVYAQINQKRLDEDNIFYTSSIIKIRDAFYQGNEANKYKLWRFFLFQLWYEEYKKIQKNTK